jgi:hypothetical protein
MRAHAEASATTGKHLAERTCAGVLLARGARVPPAPWWAHIRHFMAPVPLLLQQRGAELISAVAPAAQCGGPAACQTGPPVQAPGTLPCPQQAALFFLSVCASRFAPTRMLCRAVARACCQRCVLCKGSATRAWLLLGCSCASSSRPHPPMHQLMPLQRHQRIAQQHAMHEASANVYMRGVGTPTQPRHQRLPAPASAPAKQEHCPGTRAHRTTNTPHTTRGGSSPNCKASAARAPLPDDGGGAILYNNRAGVLHPRPTAPAAITQNRQQQLPLGA